MGCAAPPEADPPLGVVLTRNDHIESDMAAIRAMGMRWVRVLPDWTSLETSPGVYDWHVSDDLVRSARQNGLSLVYTLGYTPRWASLYPNDAEMDVWNKNRPAQWDTWQHAVETVARRYHNDVKAWQIWEQTDIHHFRGSDRDLEEMLRLATQTERPITGGAPVVAPEEGDVHLGGINRLYTFGAAPFFDVLGLAPRLARPEQMVRPLDTLQTDIIRKKGPLKNVWLSSLGWDVAPLPPYLRRPVVSEADEAAFLVRGTALALAHGAERVFWDGWCDVLEGPYQAQSHSGLLRADGTERPAAAACRDLIQHLAGRHFTASLPWGPHVWGLLFEGSSDAVVVAWSDGKPVHVADDVLLTGMPRYLEGPADKLRALAPPTPAQAADPDLSAAASVHAELSGAQAAENGLYTNRYGSGLDVVTLDGATGWQTRLADGKAAILFDVDDSWLYFDDGRWDVQVEVDVHRNATDLAMGFNVAYDGMDGWSFTPWQPVEAGSGWATYQFTLHDANFSDPFCDLRVNALGSKADVCVRSVRLTKIRR